MRMPLGMVLVATSPFPLPGISLMTKGLSVDFTDPISGDAPTTEIGSDFSSPTLSVGILLFDPSGGAGRNFSRVASTGSGN